MSPTSLLPTNQLVDQVKNSLKTVAEMRLGLSAGCDALGMSTAYEVIAARHAGMKCFAVSLITNLCQPNYNQGWFHFRDTRTDDPN